MVRRLIEQEMHWFYPWLKALARQLLSAERAGHTLQPTALTNEVLVKLLVWNGEVTGEVRPALKKMAHTITWQTLVDSGRRRQTRVKYLKSLRKASDLTASSQEASLERVRTAMERLAELDPAIAEFVRLKCIEGFSHSEAAALMSWSDRTAARRWSFAKAWLARAAAE